KAAVELAIDPPAELVKATVLRFAREHAPRAARTSLAWRTSIPRGVGLGGSSAIVIATARALCRLYAVALGPTELAEFALAVETDDLGIAGGLQDRVAQSYGGLVFMGCAQSGYEPLPRDLLPPLVVAWRTDAAGDSGPLHGDLRARRTRRAPRYRDHGDAGELRPRRARRAGEPRPRRVRRQPA